MYKRIGIGSVVTSTCTKCGVTKEKILGSTCIRDIGGRWENIYQKPHCECVDTSYKVENVNGRSFKEIEQNGIEKRSMEKEMKYRVLQEGDFFTVQFKKFGIWWYVDCPHQGGGVSKQLFLTLDDAKRYIEKDSNKEQKKKPSKVAYEIEK